MTMANRLPTGPGSRGGHWHDPEYRRAYQRAWRAAHPEYRDAERLRKVAQRAGRNGNAPADLLHVRKVRPLPRLAESCTCWCGCTEPTWHRFSEWVRDSLNNLGMPARELARRAGLSHNTVVKITRGSEPLYTNAVRLVSVLRASGVPGPRCGFCVAGECETPVPTMREIARLRRVELLAERYVPQAEMRALDLDDEEAAG